MKVLEIFNKLNKISKKALIRVKDKAKNIPNNIIGKINKKSDNTIKVKDKTNSKKEGFSKRRILPITACLTLVSIIVANIFVQNNTVQTLMTPETQKFEAFTTTNPDESTKKYTSGGTYTAPYDGKYYIEAYGAKGGNSNYTTYWVTSHSAKGKYTTYTLYRQQSSNKAYTGGNGGKVTGYIELKKGETLSIAVGGTGTNYYVDTRHSASYQTSLSTDGLYVSSSQLYDRGNYGTYGSNGGATTVKKGNTTLFTANGGNGATTSNGSAGTGSYGSDVTSGTTSTGANSGAGYVNIKFAGNDNYLLGLSVNGNSVPDFSPTTLTYNISVGRHQEEDLTVSALKGISTQNVTCSSTVLTDKENVITVEVEGGVTYTINVTWLDWDYAKLDGIKINGEEIENFDPNTSDVDIVIPRHTGDISIEGLAGATNQGIEYTRQTFTCEVKTVDEQITVTALSGEQFIYNLHFTWEGYDYSLVDDIKIAGATIEGFNPETLEYTINADNYVDKLSLEVSDGAAWQTLTYENVLDLTEPVNEFEISSISKDGSETIYKLTVNWATYNWPYLDGININTESKGVFNKEFSAQDLEYSVWVPNTTSKIKLEAIPGAGGQTIEYLDGEELTSLINPKRIKVTAKDGTEAIYNISVDYTYGRLKDIQIEHGTFTTPFSEDKNEYNVVIDKDYDEIDIKAIPCSRFTKIENDGIHTVPVGTSNVDIKAIDHDGKEVVYKLHLTRAPSNDDKLKAIYINGTEIESFDPEVNEFSYNVPREYFEANITVKKGMVSQEVILPNNELHSGTTTKQITVVSEDGRNTRTYTIHLIKEHSTRLKELVLENTNYGVEIKFGDEFDPDVLEYRFDMPKTAMSLKASYVAFDDEATVTITGNTYIDSNTKIFVEVKAPDCETTTYVINVYKGNENFVQKESYGYVGGIQKFTAEYTGRYLLEAWGAQGGASYNDGNSNARGGYGAYSKGEVYLEKGQTIYIATGEAGRNGWKKYAPPESFNGGGSGTWMGYVYGSLWNKYKCRAGGAGGGATSISFAYGTLDTQANKLDQLLLVAGGGGGASYKQAGGNAGGITGNRGDNSGGTGGTQNSGYSFGKGQNGSGRGNANGVAGGGGGYYGGCINNTTYYNGNAAGGGSGYIGNKLLTNKVMYGYGVQTSNNENTKTVSTSNVSYSAISNYAKAGNGAARITYLSLPDDNGLASISAENGTFDIEFNPDTLEYQLYLPEGINSTKLYASPRDEKAKVTGTGEYIVEGKSKVATITCTAQNGLKKEYKVKIIKFASTESRAKNIKIEGLNQELLKDHPEYGVTTPATFDKDTLSYTMLVPYETKQVLFNVELLDSRATVEGNGIQELADVENTFEIVVTAENEVDKTTYTYTITRDIASNADLKKLDVTSPQTDIGFERNKTEYKFAVPKETTTLELDIETEDPLATYEVNGLDEGTELNYGFNEITIVVTSQNGTTKTYTLNVYRERIDNVLLQNITVENNGNNLEYTPEFDRITFEYKLKVPNEIDSVDVKATAEDPDNVWVMITNEHQTLNAGKNTVTINVTSQNNCEETYTLEIEREKNSNANLANIQIFNENDTEYPLVEEFNKDKTNYTCQYKSNNSTVKIVATPEVKTTEVKLIDDNNVKKGSNIKKILAVAEDGTAKTYVVNIFKTDVDENTYLEDVKFEFEDGYRIVPEFDKEKQEYNVIIPRYYQYKNIGIFGTAESVKSKVTGNGTYSYGCNKNTTNDDPDFTDYPEQMELTLTVTAESGDTRDYVFKISQEINSKAYLKRIETDKGTVEPNFDKDVLDYTINVDKDTEEINILGVPLYYGTVVTGNGKHTLKGGDNKIELTAVSEDGKETLKYTVNVVKEKQHNANIKNLSVKEGRITPDFTQDTLQYSLKVTNEIDKPNYLVELEDENATYDIEPQLVSEGETEVKITVTAEDGETTKEYIVNVNRQAKEQFSNYLESITLSSGNLSPEFEKANMYYEMTVPLETDKITITGTPEDKDATIVGNGEYELKVGDNHIYLTVTSKDGIERTYHININRENSNDARLSKLTVANTLIKPTFNKDVYEYSLITSDTSLKFEELETLDPEATYEIKDNEFNEPGDYVVTIAVTAADKKTTQDYKLNVTREKSNNNNLKSLKVFGYEIQPEFTSENKVYNVEVPTDINQVTIEAIAELKTSKVLIGELDEEEELIDSATKSIDIDEASKIVKIIVTSETGREKVYTLTINKVLSSDNLIKYLEVNNGELKEEFNPETKEYTVNIENTETELDMQVILNDDNATYEVKGNENLQVGQNIVTIEVTAQNGDVNTYKLNVTKEAFNSVYLESMSVKDYELEQEFNKYINKYNLKVNNETTNLEITAVPEDENATVVIAGNDNLEVGDNTVTITVTKGELEEVYTINVIRQEYAMTFLDYLYTKPGTITPEYDKNTLEYKVDVYNEIEEIEIFAEATDKNATLEGTGKHTLELGENKIPVKVTSPDGVERTYYVIVNRQMKSGNYLLALDTTVNDLAVNLDKEFDKLTKDYTLNVDYSASAITFDGRISEGATVKGLGEFAITDVETTFEIVVTSQAGEDNVYTVKVIRDKDTRNHLIDLVPSVGTLEPEFDYEQDTYTIYADETMSELGFTYDTDSAKATVTGCETLVIPDGTSTRTITVTSESGVDKVYTINVIKEDKVISNNAFLQELSVTGYELDKTFDKENYEYSITVPFNKALISKNEIVAKTEDENATVEMMDVVNLSTIDENKFEILVTAEDGFTTNKYVINITRQKNSFSLLENLEPTVGVFDQLFVPTITEYTWTIPSRYKSINEEYLKYTLADEMSTIEFANAVDMTSDDENKHFDITVTSEDGESSTTYTLNLKYDEEHDARLKELNVSEGTLEPEFNSDTYEYSINVNSNEITIDAIPMLDTSKVTSGNGVLTLEKVDTKHTITVEAENGLKENYILNIHIEDFNIEYYDGETKLEDLEPSTYTFGEGVDTLPEAQKDGYKFEGWYLEDTLTTKVENIGTDEIGDKTLYAKFVVEEYSIAYYYGETKLEGLEPTTYTYGEGVDTLPELEIEGYTFEGWFAENTFATKVEKIGTDETGDKVFYAKLIQKNEYTITYFDGKNEITGLEPYSYVEGEEKDLPTYEKEGYTFEGWYYTETFDEGTEVSKITKDDFGNKEVYAKLVANEYTITYFDGENKITDLTPNKYVYGEGLEELPTYEKEGFTFEGWYSDKDFAEDTKVESIDMTTLGDITLYAKLTEANKTGKIKGQITTPETLFTTGKNIANVYVFKQEEVENIVNLEEKQQELLENFGGDNINTILQGITPVTECVTNDDGTYELELEEGNYVVLVDKSGYLDLIYTNISIQNGTNIETTNEDLIAGDTNKDGVINNTDVVDVYEQLPKADFDNSGEIDNNDTVIVYQNGSMTRKIIDRKVGGV